MDHRYIDEHSLADRYLDRALAPAERGEFEAHLVDCQECRDRLLLAEMFHARNGLNKLPDAPVPVRIRLWSRFAVSHIMFVFALAATAAILLLLASAALFSLVLRPS
jgi:anti-sigma factor RsiW